MKISVIRFPARIHFKKPDWLRVLLLTARRPAGYDTCVNYELPSLITDGYQLRLKDMNRVMYALCQSTPINPHPLLVAIRDYADRDWLDEWVFVVVDRCLNDGTEIDRMMIVWAVGFFASERGIVRLAPLIYRLMRPHKSRKYKKAPPINRFVIALRSRSDDATLLCLHQMMRIIESLDYVSHQQITDLKDALKDVSIRRLLNPEQSADYAAYSGETGIHGQFVLRVGTEKLTILIGERVHLQDAEGQILTELPIHNSDPIEQRRAVLHWRSIRRQIRDSIKFQTYHLEQAMLAERTWAWQDFDVIVLRNPLMRYLAQHLVWGFSGEGHALMLFRVDDEGQLLDENDEIIKPDTDCDVRIVHPVHLTERQRQRWIDVFMDYEIMPLFEQMSRPLFTLPDDVNQQDESDLLRYFGALHWEDFKSRIPGWKRNGHHEWRRHIPFAGLMMIVRPHSILYQQRFTGQESVECVFHPDVIGYRRMTLDVAPRLLCDLSPVVISEAIALVKDALK